MMNIFEDSDFLCLLGIPFVIGGVIGFGIGAYFF